MKDIRVVGIAVFGALAFAACAAKADTVVWYTFDDLGDVGTALADGTNIVNKANPGGPRTSPDLPKTRSRASVPIS